MNWKTTYSGIAAALMATLTTLALIPNDTGMQFIPEPWRSRIIVVGGISALILRVLNSRVQADAKNPTDTK